MSDHDIEGCHHVLDEWESYEPQASPTIHGLRATVVLMEGDVIKSKLMMEEALASLEGTTLSSESADTIRGFYTQALHFASYDEDLELVSYLGGSSAMVVLCKGKQPKGVKVKYWFGIAQIVAAVVVAPFNPPAAGALALSGLNTTIQAAGDAMDNKEEWERNLNDRQHMGPDSMPPVQRSSLMPSIPFNRIVLVQNENKEYHKHAA